MSILIKGMAMPKNCGDCPCYYYEYKECNAIGGRMVFRNATPPTDCPLIELPPHGKWQIVEKTYRISHRTVFHLRICCEQNIHS